MRILDTNIWVYAFTGEDERAMALVDGAASGEYATAVDTYLYLETIAAFSRSEALDNRATTRAQDQFAQLGWGDSPSVKPVVDPELVDRYDDVERGIRAIRSRPGNVLLAETLDVQVKDAPVVTLAARFRYREPTIHTGDRGFGAFEPAEQGLDRLAVEHVEVG